MQLEQKRADEKVERDKLNKVYLELIEQQRTYYKSVRDFQEVSSLLVQMDEPRYCTDPDIDSGTKS